MYDSQYHKKPVMVARRRLTDQERHLAVARIRTGSTQCDVADELGVSQSVISRLVYIFRDTGSAGERPRSGAPRGTTRNVDQYLRTYALRNMDLTAPVLQSRLREVRGTRVSRQTIRNRLHHFGLRARRPLQVTPLTDRHRRLRLQWARDHVTWNIQQWSSVLFTDESRITLHRNDGCQRRWRRLQARARQPRGLPELRVAVVEEWNELPQNNFNRLFRSMIRRCQAVIDARGGNTRY